jgi:threonyl-tRNA synthetase
MAQAVKELWPGVKLGIGPATEDGFYYDFDKKGPFAPEDLVKIEERMRQIIKKMRLLSARNYLKKKQRVCLKT